MPRTASCSTATRATAARSTTSTRSSAARRVARRRHRARVPRDESIARLRQRALRAGPHRRHRGGHRQPPRDLRARDRADPRRLPRARHRRADRRRRHARRGHRAHLRGARRRADSADGATTPRLTPCVFRRSIYKSPAELRAMVEPAPRPRRRSRRRARLIAPGATPLELDAAAERVIRGRGGGPNFQLVPGYRHTLCVSVDDDVVHGIPATARSGPGDIVSVDGGAEVGGLERRRRVHRRAARPDAARRRRRRARRCRASTEGALGRHRRARDRPPPQRGRRRHRGLRGEAAGEYGILTGLRRARHRPHDARGAPGLQLPRADPGPAVRPGLVVAIEPMIVAGAIDTFVATTTGP